MIERALEHQQWQPEKAAEELGHLDVNASTRI